MQTSNHRIMLRTFVPLTVVVLVVGLYTSSLDNPMIMEDQAGIVANPLVDGSRSIWESWTSPSFDLAGGVWDLDDGLTWGSGGGAGDGAIRYQPITVLSFRINHWITGMSPIGFRLVNIGLLALLGLLTVGWLNRYTEYPAAALLASLLFVGHPSNAESINHLIGRGEILAMIGVVGFAWVQRVWLVRVTGDALAEAGDGQIAASAGTPAGVLWRVVTAVGVLLLGAGLGGLAIFSSPTGLVVIPVAIMQPLLSRSRRRGVAYRRGWTVVFGGWACLGIAGWLYTQGTQIALGVAHTQQLVAGNDAGIGGIEVAGSLAERLPGALWLAGFYGRQIFAPSTLLLNWPARVPQWSTPTVYIGAAILIAGCGCVLAGVYRKRWGVLGVGMILGQYVLVSNLVWPRVHYASNLWMMPFTLGTAVVIAKWIDRSTEPMTGRRSTRRLAVVMIPSSIIVVVMALGVWQVNQRWFSSARLMAWELSKRPNAPALMYGYGRALTEVGEYTQARFWLESAVAERPGSVRVRHALALVHLMLGDPNAATHQYLRIIELTPGDCTAQTRVAALALSDGEHETAALHLAHAKRHCPHDADVMYHYARLAEAQANPAEAIRRYEALLRRWPNNMVGRSDLEKLVAQEQN